MYFSSRARALRERVASQLETHEIRADVTTDDDDALISIATENLDAVVIGGGVRAPSRDRIVEAAAERNVRIVNGSLLDKDLDDYVRTELMPALRAAP